MPLNQMQKMWLPDGPMDMIGRFFTPGATYLHPAEDPFYVRQIMASLNPQPEQRIPGGIDYIQQMAGKYGDTETAASTVGVKSLKANKIKKSKR